MMKINENAQAIIHALRRAGYEAFAVGGCVRDALLGKEPQDWDITTSAEPEEIKAVFPVTIDTGIEHGTVTVRRHGESYEVTTFRMDGKYKDHRRPEEVIFTKTLEEDLLRRDFTINAMAYSEETGLIDLYGGQEDLAKGIIRCVGEPMKRIEEDALRILRAFRFAAQLDFTIEPETREAIRTLAKDLEYISAERIQMEMTKILTSDHPEIIREMYELGVTKVILPEFDPLMTTGQNTPHHCGTVGEHTIRALCGIEPKAVLRWTMLIHDMGKPEAKRVKEDGIDTFKGHARISAEMARRIMARMKMDNATRDAVVKLVEAHDDRPPAEIKAVRRMLAKIGSNELFEDYCKVRRADVLAQSEYLREEKLANLDGVEALFEQIVAENQCVKIADLAVGGRDLIAEGLAPGPQIGEALKKMLDWVLEDPSLNEKETLLAKWRAEEA